MLPRGETRPEVGDELLHGEGVHIESVAQVAAGVMRPAREGASKPGLVWFGGFFSLAGLLVAITVYADRALVASLLTTSAVAYYTVPFSVVSRLGFIPGTITYVLLPATVQRRSRPRTPSSATAA